MPKSTIKRTLYYYDLYASHIDKSSKESIQSYQYITDFLSDLYSQQLQATNYKNYIQVTKNKNNLFVAVDTVEESYIEFRMVLCRLDALPFIEKDGNFVSCQAKLNFDAYAKIIADKEYSLFDFAVKSNSDIYNKVLSQKSIFRAIRNEVPNTDTIEVVLKKRKTSKNKFSGFTPPFALEDIMEILKNYRDDITRFNVSQDALSDKIDLLSDKLVNRVTMVRTDKRTIDSKEMYKEIRNFFNSTVINYCKE